MDKSIGLIRDNYIPNFELLDKLIKKYFNLGMLETLIKCDLIIAQLIDARSEEIDIMQVFRLYNKVLDINKLFVLGERLNNQEEEYKE